jgi:hypothetical protein
MRYIYIYGTPDLVRGPDLVRDDDGGLGVVVVQEPADHLAPITAAGHGVQQGQVTQGAHERRLRFTAVRARRNLETLGRTANIFGTTGSRSICGTSSTSHCNAAAMAS